MAGAFAEENFRNVFDHLPRRTRFRNCSITTIDMYTLIGPHGYNGETGDVHLDLESRKVLSRKTSGSMTRDEANEASS